MKTKLFMFEGYEREFELDYSTKNNNFWLDLSEENLLVTDKQDNVIYTVKANCSQNSGFLKTFY